MRPPLTRSENIVLTIIIIHLTVSLLCQLLLVRPADYIVNLSDFYSYRFSVLPPWSKPQVFYLMVFSLFHSYLLTQGCHSLTALEKKKFSDTFQTSIQPTLAEVRTLLVDEFPLSKEVQLAKTVIALPPRL
jgi:hypothetical protein